MFSTSSTTYAAAKFPCCRCLSAVSADTTQHRFVLGTGGAREQNEVQVLDFDEESNRLGCVGRVAHAGEVFALAPSPADASTFASCGGGPDASVWALDAAEFGEGAADDALSDGEGPGVLGRDQPALRRAVSNASDDGGWADGAAAGDAVAPRDLRKLAGAATAGPCRSLAWSPRDHGAPNALAALDGAKLRFYDVAASAEPTVAVDVAAPFGGARATAASWSPHDAAEVHVASRDGAVRAYDARSSAAPRLVVAPDGGPCFAVDGGVERYTSVFSRRETRRHPTPSPSVGRQQPEQTGRRVDGPRRRHGPLLRPAGERRRAAEDPPGPRRLVRRARVQQVPRPAPGVGRLRQARQLVARVVDLERAAVPKPTTGLGGPHQT